VDVTLCETVIVFDSSADPMDDLDTVLSYFPHSTRSKGVSLHRLLTCGTLEAALYLRRSYVAQPNLDAALREAESSAASPQEVVLRLAEAAVGTWMHAASLDRRPLEPLLKAVRRKPDGAGPSAPAPVPSPAR
jgi:hypothetical protein